MVERTTCTTDARGAEAALTRGRPRPAARRVVTHLDGVRRYFLDVVDRRRPRRRSSRAWATCIDGLGDASRRARAPGPRGRRLTPGRVPRRVASSPAPAASPTRPGRRASTRRAARSRDLLPHYASRLAACELNNTFYARPRPEKIAGLVRRDAARVPVRRQGPAGRQRPGPVRATRRVRAVADRALPRFGERLGAVLFRVRARSSARTSELGGAAGRLAGVDPARARGAARRRGTSTRRSPRCARRAPCCARPTSTSSRSRRTSAGRARSCTCACGGRPTTTRRSTPGRARLVPFLDDGLDAYVLFRHDEDGTSAVRAEAFADRVDRVARRRAAARGTG